MPISRLIIHKAIADAPQTVSIKSLFDVPIEVVNGSKQVFGITAGYYDPIQMGKEILFLTRNKGAFIKDCPGTRHYNCCGYKILHVGTFCTMDCSYCILQAYFHPPILQLFMNYDDMFKELNRYLSLKTISRIGTGEFTDSLIWERWTDLTERLVLRFARQSHAVLELKTKTASIEALRSLDHERKTILSWSLNTPRIIKTEERRTAKISARLKAAQQCESLGYPIAFHFDPILIYKGCEREYGAVVDQIFSHVSSRNIVWISLGTFRFMPSLKPIIQKRFPASKIVYGEFIPGLDGKMRYFKPLRIKIYRHIISRIREHAPDLSIYFCMEDDEVWDKAMGYVPASIGGISHLLDESAKRHCDLTSS